MTILCAGSTHVYRVGNLHCTCGAAANGYSHPSGYFQGSPPSGVAMYGSLPYNPFAQHAPAPPAPDLPLAVLQAARDAGGQFLSADGERAYCERYGLVLQAEWDGTRFGSWFNHPEGLPGGEIKL